VLEMGSNIGFAAANNAGAEFFLRETALPYLLLLNNDAFLEADTLQRLTRAMADQVDVGIAAPKTYYYPPPPVRLWYAGGAIDWKQGSCEHWGFGGLDRGQYDVAKRVTFAPGAALLIRRALVESIGLFDERYFMFEEDVDLSIRAAKSGFGILYLPDAVVWHRVGRSANKRGNAFIWYHLVRNRLYTMHKHASRTQWLQFVLYFPILWLWKAVYYSAHGQFDVARAMVRGCSDYRTGRMGRTLTPDVHS
ncbi:MAG: glycosyltransferase family 2 protein, partial [Anaerolineales bacterium]|nr:glycosyltransferase family 2 protein [Anaerolineales bacterium]